MQTDWRAYAAAFRTATPFPFACIDRFLTEGAAREVAAAFPSFEEARGRGRAFRAVNERRKVQVTDPSAFPEPLQRLCEELASDAFRAHLSQLSGIPDLLWDDDFVGGGMHLTGSTGHLDVHVDFNRIPERQLYRRVNLLLFLNEVWDDAWGGRLELWDRDVRTCVHSFAPLMNRAVIFETSERSWHGVTSVCCPPGTVRRSFALYYYTREAPGDYAGHDHTTRFRARPSEPIKKFVTMPLERFQKGVVRAARRGAALLR